MTTYDVDGHLAVRVRIGRGRLEVAAGPDGLATVTVTALDPADTHAVDAASRTKVELSDGRLTVETPTRAHQNNPPALRIALVVPVGTDLKTSAGDVDIDAAVALGQVQLRMGNGAAALADCSGKVDVKAGNITLAVGDADDLQVAAGNAKVTAGAVGAAGLRVGAGALTLASSTGRVTARGGQVELVVASTATGEIDFRAAAGSATIGVAAGTGVHLDLVSAVGDVSCTLPVESEAPTGGASLSLRLHTGAGDLRVHRVGEEPPPASSPAAHGFPDIGRIVEDAMSNVQVQLDRAGLSGIRIDVRGSDRSRPRWAEKLEKVVRNRADTTRTRYVGPLWGADGPVVEENSTWFDGRRVPVDGPVNDAQVTELRTAGYDGALVAQLPVDGPWSVGELLTVCRAGLADVVTLVNQLPVDGPLSPALLAELVEDGLSDIVRRIQATPLDGPVDTDDLLPRFGRESD